MDSKKTTYETLESLSRKLDFLQKRKNKKIQDFEIKLKKLVHG